MSWGFDATIPVECTHSTDAAAAVLEAARREWEAPIELEEESRHQVTVAVNEAAAIVASGALGHLYPIRAVLNGHSSPRHEGGPGYSCDHVNIYITQARPLEELS